MIMRHSYLQSDGTYLDHEAYELWQIDAYLRCVRLNKKFKRVSGLTRVLPDIPKCYKQLQDWRKQHDY